MIKLLLTWHNKTIDGGFKKLFHNHIINVYLFSVCICYLHSYSHTNIQTHLADWLKYHLSILLNDSICNWSCLDMNFVMFSGGITLRIKRLKHFHIFANENILVLQCLDIWYQKGIHQLTKNMILWRWYVPLIFVKLFQQKRETQPTIWNQVQT